MKIDEGIINITGKIVLITATGTPSINISNINTARIDAEKMARKNLKFRLEKAFSKIVLEKGVDLGKHLASKKETDFFTGLIKDDDPAEIVSTRYFSDGSVEIEYSVPVGKFLEQIKLKTMPDICRDEKMQTVFPEEMEGVADSRKDVLIIEIKSGKLDPALYLTLENEKGELIYSSCLSGTVPSMIVRKNPSRFLEILNSKESFLTVPALKVKSGSTVVIGSTDAEKIANEMKRSSLKEGKVIFLIKEKEGK
ncbi:MAG TPA: hypothetical protein PLW78_00035 [bacterium]|nr:hypothetical protein [bacterium]HPG35678.1 hypothetical protein [bacterium]HPM47692.1 hypothetical protein [bacterium]HRQ68661.1 hypothetical protein [bacterium]